jgi:enterochelin esterase-like enzyme
MPDAIWDRTVPLGTTDPCHVFIPPASDRRVPLAYLLHGQFDSPEDWWGAKGQIPGILTGLRAAPMILVMPLCVAAAAEDRKAQQEPPLAEFLRRFDAIDQAVREQYASRIDPQKRAILGISMGGKQALALRLLRPDFSAVGVLSGKLQGGNKDELLNFVRAFPQAYPSTPTLYFHYCGAGRTDQQFYGNNEAVCSSLGGQLRSRPDGEHNWWFWRPQMAEFFRLWLPSHAAQPPLAEDAPQAARP